MLLTRSRLLAAGLAWCAAAHAAPARAQEVAAAAAPSGGSDAPLEARSSPPGTTGGALPEVAGDSGRASIAVRTAFVDTRDDGDGNPFLDETQQVVEPVIIYDYHITDDTELSVTVSYDHVSSASIERLDNFREQSGASADDYGSLEIGLRHRFTDAAHLGLRFGGSGERDYLSVHLGGDADITLNGGNTSLSASVTAFSDFIDVIRFNGLEDEGFDERFSITADFGFYQVLTPTLHAEVGYTLGYQRGFLESNINAVVLEGTSSAPNPNLEGARPGVEITEELPELRIRQALYGRVRQYLPTRTAVEIGGRLYDDDWGITSAAIEPRVYQWVVEDVLLVRFRYRYYRQTAADAFREHFLERTLHRTQDSDLGEFHSHTSGVRLDLFLGDADAFDAAFDFVRRSDGFESIIVAAGWKHEL